jgi:hypothetical protein
MTEIIIIPKEFAPMFENMPRPHVSVETGCKGFVHVRVSAGTDGIGVTVHETCAEADLRATVASMTREALAQVADVRSGLADAAPSVKGSEPSMD